MASIDLKNAVMTLEDSDDNSLEVKLGSGNLTYSESKPRVYTNNRGVLDDVRNGDEEPVDVSLDCIWEFLKAKDGDPPTIEDAFKKRGGAANWVSSDTDDACRPYSVDIVILYTPPCGGVFLEKIVLKNFRYEKINHDARNAQLQITGKCNVTEAVVTRIDPD